MYTNLEIKEHDDGKIISDTNADLKIGNAVW